MSTKRQFSVTLFVLITFMAVLATILVGLRIYNR